MGNCTGSIAKNSGCGVCEKCKTEKNMLLNALKGAPKDYRPKTSYNISYNLNLEVFSNEK